MSTFPQENMHALYLVIGDETLRGMTTAHFIQIFSVTDFIRIVCRTTESYARLLWKRLKRDTSKFTEVKKDLFLGIQSNKIIKSTTIANTATDTDTAVQ